jgi:hypothetical protein
MKLHSSNDLVMQEVPGSNLAWAPATLSEDVAVSQILLQFIIH